MSSSEGIDTLYDELALELTDGFSPYGMTERIVGFDHENDQVLIQLSNDVAAAAAAYADEDLADGEG